MHLPGRPVGAGPFPGAGAGPGRTIPKRFSSTADRGPGHGAGGPDAGRQEIRGDGFRELLGYIRKVEAEGYAATAYRVDLWAKIAFPFICIILCLVGTGIAAKTALKDGMAVSIAYGIGIAFLYWIFYSFCLSLGYGGMLPPPVAAWSANLVFLCLGVFTLIQAE